MPISRHKFLGLSALALAGVAASGKMSAAPLLPKNQSNPVPPTVVSSCNGLRGVAKAYGLMTQK